MDNILFVLETEISNTYTLFLLLNKICTQDCKIKSVFRFCFAYNKILVCAMFQNVMIREITATYSEAI